MLRSLLLVVALGTVARAQPGASAPPSPPPAAVAPPVVAPPPAATVPVAPSVMDKRWAIGLSLGSQTLAPSIDSGQKIAFGIVELAGRFRIRPRIELGLSLVGGGAMKGTLSSGGLFIDVRYRFRPARELDVFALAGLGVLTASRKEATDVEKQGRGALRLGAGVEWRFARAVAAEAELRILGIGENPDVPAPSPETLSYQVARYGLSGGSLTLGATVYF